MRLKIGRPWQRDLTARGYGKGISQLFWAKMEDGEGDEIRVGKAPAEEEESEDDDDQEMSGKMDVDQNQLSGGIEGNANNASSQASDDDEQVQTNGYHEHEMDGEMGLVTKQRDDDEGFLDTEFDTAANGEMDGMVIDEDVELDGEADVDKKQPENASQSFKGDANIEASGLQEMQVDHNDAFAEEMDINEDLLV
ncbi:hypothetical protein TI39_contig4431g00004 [Zymoseptoria brevis]|uniref:Uncharacterized protein n=1 Tax=Zymoseptoria brevis TaxID=1047168 RepID=A0A0F4G7S1_9PEZI|nr:hypothetical protein TI39_contig4431g00004 [Zymoseptoria brevis]